LVLMVLKSSNVVVEECVESEGDVE
jgi:hypothetical protein